MKFFFLLFFFLVAKNFCVVDSWKKYFQYQIANLELIENERYLELSENLKGSGEGYELEIVIGSRGSSDSQFLLPTDLVIEKENLVVVDSGNERIQFFDLNGNFLKTWKSQDLQKPLQIRFHKDEIYVLDQGDSTIKIFDSDFRLVATLGKQGVGRGDLNFPVSMAIDRSDLIWVSDEKSNRFVIYSRKPLFGREDPYFMGIDEYEPNQYLRAPKSVLYSSSKDRIYVVDSGTARILSFDSSGNFTGVFENRRSDDKKVFMPQGIYMDQENNFYVSDNISHRILKYSPSGETLGEIGFASQFPLHRQGNEDHESRKSSPLTSWFIPQDSMMSFPHNIAVDSFGDLWVSDWGNSRIKKFSRGFFRKGLDAYRKKDFILAISYFKKCSSANPSYHIVEFYLAMCHYYLGELEAIFEKKLQWFALSSGYLESLKLKGEIGKYENRWIREKALYYLTRVGSYVVRD